MHRLAGLLALLLIGLTTSPARAQAPGTSVTPGGSTGRLVMVELVGGLRVKGRVARVTAEGVVLRFASGATRTYFWEQIVRVALYQRGASGWDPSWRRVPKTPPMSARPWQPPDFYSEALGLRVVVGGFVDPRITREFNDDDLVGVVFGGFELVLAGLHWRHFYWEIFRGVVHGFSFMGVGSAAGVPVRLDSVGRHELRVGLHLTLNLLYMGSEPKYMVGASGVQLMYQYRLYKRFALNVGLYQYSYPIALSMFFGFSL